MKIKNNGMTYDFPEESEHPVHMGRGHLSMGICYEAVSKLVELFTTLSGLQQAGGQGTEYTKEDARSQFYYDFQAEIFVRKVKHMLLGKKKLRRPIE